MAQNSTGTTNPTAQIHRFRNRVAVYIGTGQTVYIDPETAAKFATQMLACAKDIKLREYIDSKFTPRDFDFGDQNDLG